MKIIPYKHIPLEDQYCYQHGYASAIQKGVIELQSYKCTNLMEIQIIKKHSTHISFMKVLSCHVHATSILSKMIFLNIYILYTKINHTNHTMCQL